MSALKNISLFEPCLILNNFKDDLKLEFNSVVLKALKGNYDSESEVIEGLQLLKSISNDSEDVSKLFENKEFIQRFFIICLSSQKKDFILTKEALEALF